MTTADQDIHELFRTIARGPRFAGSEDERVAQGLCAKLLERRGFTCVERPFDYSAWPAVWGTPTVSAILCFAALTLWSASATYAHAPAMFRAALCSSLTLFGIAVVVAVITGRYGTTVLPVMRRSSANIEAVRHANPTFWLVAHLDSKSQPIPMLLRVISIVTLALAWVSILVLSAYTLIVYPMSAYAIVLPSPPVREAFTALSVIAIISAIPLILCTVGNKSPGALDNASGVATILCAAGHIARTDPDVSFGVLLTSAEELGLAGARAWVRASRFTRTTPDPLPVVLNCDSVDDAGPIVIMWSAKEKQHVRDLVRSVGHRYTSVQAQVQTRRLIPGILVDAVAFTHAGWPAMTISRGRWWSLARIHGRADHSNRMTGAGIEETAQVVTDLAGAIIAKARTSGISAIPHEE